MPPLEVYGLGALAAQATTRVDVASASAALEKVSALPAAELKKELVQMLTAAVAAARATDRSAAQTAAAAASRPPPLAMPEGLREAMLQTLKEGLGLERPEKAACSDDDGADSSQRAREAGSGSGDGADGTGVGGTVGTGVVPVGYSVVGTAEGSAVGSAVGAAVVGSAVGVVEGK